jgi:hypothetical protein
MKKRVFFTIIAVLTPVLTSFSQETNPTPTRPRIVLTNPSPMPSKTVVVTDSIPKTTPTPIPKPSVTPTPIVVGTPNTTNQNLSTNTPNLFLPLGQIRAKIAEAKREMQGRPMIISQVEGTSPISPLEMVRVAFYDRNTRQLDYVVLTKDSFLTKDTEFILFTSSSKSVKFRTIRPNGVNTPVTITDMQGKLHLPLMVQYPVVRNNIYYETAYYMSTHPGLVTPEIINAGKIYIKNTIDVAREKLRQKGHFITPKVADMAERLTIVEHVDHYRFRTEYHPNIYNDIFTLYALNEGQTYRYSVSSAGAGGMVQMIPSTYRMVRARFPNVGLMPDFVAGMQNHGNAAQAMLLYMQMTYNDLVSNATVYNAIQTGIANENELMSAGYNSNPAKLSGYIKRGGSGWRNLIPRETKIYLQINESMDKFVPIIPRTK